MRINSTVRHYSQKISRGVITTWGVSGNFYYSTHNKRLLKSSIQGDTHNYSPKVLKAIGINKT